MRLGAVTVVAALVLAGCATDDPPTVDGGRPRGAQPLPGPDGRFFAGLPLLPEATELSPPLRRHGVISQSFLARDATHRQVVDFYSDNLILYPDATPQLDDREDAEPSVDTEADP